MQHDAKDQRVRIAIFASGTGSNLCALAEESMKHSDSLRIAAVIIDNPRAGAAQKARDLGLPVHLIVPPPLSPGLGRQQIRQQHEQAILAVLYASRVQWIFLAGYMRILSPAFLHHFWDTDGGYYRIVNIHPSLLPQFPGKNAYEQAFAAGVGVAGVTVHLVDEGVDTGRIIAQERFVRHADDDFTAFCQRGLAIEHRLYPRVLARVAREGGLELQ